MIFNSLTFVVFFAAVLLIDRCVPNWTLRKVVLLAAGYLFYAAWNPAYVWLLIGSTLINWCLARIVGTPGSQPQAVRTSILVGAVTLNLAVLCYFKYIDFFLQNVAVLWSWGGPTLDVAPLSPVLPLAISFCTFEAIAYLVDVYRGDHTPNDSLVDFGLYISFFPHLVAGPIVRPNDFLPQLREPKRATGDQLGWGLFLLTLGLFEKVILADGILAPPASYVFGQPHLATTDDAWTGVLAFAFQIYFDFAGYSTCAIGAAWCLGIELKRNFRFPYAAIGFSDFWRRWHISLSSWLRDYLYRPLGGSRYGELLTARNLMLTMLLGGLWHGAAWNFVIWGGLHGMLLVIERSLRSVLGEVSFGIAGRVLLGALTFLGVCIGWVFFRAADLETAFTLLTALAGWPAAETPLLARRSVQAVLTVVLSTLAVQWWLRESTLEAAIERAPWWSLAMACSVMWVSVALYGGDEATFLYFQF
ncbi:MAG: MBOAT family O-acyltransferase [Planctomycetaceae bacterium]|nr:MBOAT family O-acyltransferase [Planctomycetaceae bacterium]